MEYDVMKDGKKVGTLTMDDPILPEPPVDPSDVTISKTYGYGTVSLRAAKKFAGAFDSFQFNGKEFLNSEDPGRLLQSAFTNELAEAYNPTEGGKHDDVGTSSSKLLERRVAAGYLASNVQCAFWNPVGGKVLSDYILYKDVTIGHPASDYVIQYLTAWKVPEPNAVGQFEVLTGYMPLEFGHYYVYDNAMRDVAPIEGSGMQLLPIIASTEDGGFAMGVYSPDANMWYGRFRDCFAQGVAKWNIVRRYEPIADGDYSFRCYVVFGSLQSCKVSMAQLYDYYYPEIPVPPEPPIEGEITDFAQVPGTIGDKTYFSVGMLNGEIHYGEYGRQDNYRCNLYKLPRVKVAEFDAESIFNICDGIITIEQGGPNRKAQIWYNGQCVFEHPRWNIALNCHKHTDGRYYVSGQYYGDPSDPAGVLVSSDKVHWSEYFTNPYEYRFYDMCSKDGNLWIASTSSGMDWGENNCNPAVFCNGGLVWRDTDHTNCGHWGIASFRGDIFLGRTGRAGVVRLSDHKTVLDLSSYKSVMKMIVVDDTLMAFVSSYSATGARVYATKDGDNWYQINGDFSVPSIYGAYQDGSDVYLATGSFDRGPGKFYRSVMG